MAVTDISNTEAANFIPELWANSALGKLGSFLNLARTVNRNFDTKPATYGDTIHIPKRGTLTAYEKAQNDSVTLQAPTATKVDISLDQHWEVSFIVEDIAAAQANQDIMAGYVEDAVITLAEKIEVKLAALYASAGNDVNSSTALTDAKMLEARKILVDEKLPKLAPKYGYFDSSAINDLLALDKFTRVEDYGGSGVPVMTGELGTIYGIKIFESQLVQTSGSPSTYHCMVYGPDAMVLAMRPLPKAPQGAGVNQAVISDPEAGLGIRVSYSWNQDALGMQVTLDTLFGVGVMRSEHLVDVYHT